jgi:ABC-type cobalamin/Fe3+-siderophores transport system ATPase subunit
MKVALLTVGDAPQQPELLLRDEPESFIDLDARLLLKKSCKAGRAP